MGLSLLGLAGVFWGLLPPEARAQTQSVENRLWLYREGKPTRPPKSKTSQAKTGEPARRTRPFGKNASPLRRSVSRQPKRLSPQPVSTRRGVLEADLPPLPGAESAPKIPPSQAVFSPPASPQTRHRLLPGAPSAAEGMAPDPDFWRGLSQTQLEKAVLSLPLSSPSPVRQALWQRLLTQPLGPDTSPTALRRYTLLRHQLLYRAGWLKPLLAAFAAQAGQEGWLQPFHAQALLATGRRRAACDLARNFPLTDRDRLGGAYGLALRITVYCAAWQKDYRGAALLLEVGREAGVRDPVGEAVVNRLLGMEDARFAAPKTLRLLDYLFLRLLPGSVPRRVVALATPAVLHAIATDTTLEPGIRLAAAERAARDGIIDAEILAAAYDALAQHGGGAEGALRRRARLLRQIAVNSTAQEKARKVEAILSSLGRAPLSVPLARLLADKLADMSPRAELVWFAPTAARIAATAGRFSLAARWAELGLTAGGPAGRMATGWLPVIEIAAGPGVAPRDAGLQMATELARQGQLRGLWLHRVVTAFEALKYQVPIALWQAAGRAPQPTGGFLPPTGVLGHLRQAAEAGETGRTLLLALTALGPQGPAGANLLVLGDVIRALREVGEEALARQVAFEALSRRLPRN